MVPSGKLESKSSPSSFSTSLLFILKIVSVAVWIIAVPLLAPIWIILAAPQLAATLRFPIEIAWFALVQTFCPIKILLSALFALFGTFVQVGGLLLSQLWPICIEFGFTEEIDYFTNCDGEHDRYGTKWIQEYKITLNTNTIQ